MFTNDDVMNTIVDGIWYRKDSGTFGNGAAELHLCSWTIIWIYRGFVPAPGFSEYQASMDAANIPVREIFYRQRQNDDGNLIF